MGAIAQECHKVSPPHGGVEDAQNQAPEARFCRCF